MIGVNTPESVHPDESKNTEFGKIASDYTKSQLEGEEVRLELDAQERDQYGRLLQKMKY
jgi:micrococcal nuclease